MVKMGFTMLAIDLSYPTNSPFKTGMFLQPLNAGYLLISRQDITMYRWLPFGAMLLKTKEVLTKCN